MRLLLTSDLHRDGNKLLWLLDEAPQHDALLVAGDLLDIFSNTGLTDQKSGALLWRDTFLKSGRSFAWCSGNHDFFHGDHTPMAAASPLWMRENPSTKSFVITPFSAACLAGFPEGIDLLLKADSEFGCPEFVEAHEIFDEQFFPAWVKARLHAHWGGTPPTSA